MSTKLIFNPLSPIFGIRKVFSQRINILIIEDNQHICHLLREDFFRSPLFNKKEVNTFDGAKKAIFGSLSFHCWVLDLTLEDHNDGLELCKLKPNFPYCIVVSGAESMSDATEALKNGAYGVHDKKVVFFSGPHQFIEEVCSLAVLSFMLKARKPKKFEIFQLLVRGFIDTPEKWSYSCWINARTFRRLCEEESSLTARQFLALFHALKAATVSDCLLEGMIGFEELRDKIIQHVDFYEKSGEYVLNHLETVFGPRFLY